MTSSRYKLYDFSQLTLGKCLLSAKSASKAQNTFTIRRVFCATGSEKSPPGGETAPIRVTDAPPENVSSIGVTVSNIEVHRALATEDGWVTVVSEEKTFDLVEIAGAEVFLGEKEVEAGRYTEIRLDVTRVSVTADGQTYDARLPGDKLRVVRSWEVKAIDGDTIWLSGVQIPGWSAGALVELTPTAGSEDGLLLRLEDVDGIQARAVPAAQEQDVQGASVPRSARLGDRAVLVVPGERASVLEVYVPPETESDAPSAALREDIAASIADEGLGAVVRLVPWLASLELSAPGGRVELRDGGGDTLNRFQTLPDGRPVTRADLSWVVATSLGQYARQRVLLQLRGHEGERFANNDSLQVQVVPAPFKADCPGIHWPEEQQPTNEPQVVPLCHPWQIQVRNTSRSTLLVGGGVLTTDGGIFSLPWAGAERPYLVIPPGQTAIFDRDEPQACFTGTPPFHVPTHIVVVGTQKDEPVDWRLLSAQAISRDPTAGDIQSALAGCLMGARDAGTRLDLSDWTTTHLTVQTLSPDTPQPTPTGQAP